MTDNHLTASSAAKPKRGRPTGTAGTRERILAGAIAAFSKEGYERTSVERILENAGCSRRTFYQFYANKEELFSEIAKRAIAVMLWEIEAATEKADTLEGKLEAAIESYLRSCMGAGPIARALLAEPMPPGSEAARTRAHAMKSLQEMIQREILNQRGENVDPLVTHSLVAALDAVAVRLATEKAPGEWNLERAKRVMFRVMGAALAGPDDTAPPLPLVDDSEK